jgi:Recombination endonuclease VII
VRGQGRSGWTCRRVNESVVCGHRNPPRSRRCAACGKARPPRRRAAHLRALNLDYAVFVELNGGEYCGICQAPRPANRRLDRDHDHDGTGRPRGLLCRKCNRTLVKVRFGLKLTPEWLRAAAAYLERAEARA